MNYLEFDKLTLELCELNGVVTDLPDLQCKDLLITLLIPNQESATGSAIAMDTLNCALAITFDPQNRKQYLDQYYLLIDNLQIRKRSASLLLGQMLFCLSKWKMPLISRSMPCSSGQQ